MGDESKILIQGKEIDFEIEEREIYSLKYLEKNPRIGSIIFNEKISSLSKIKRQERIDEKMRNEPSVKKIEKSIETHGGLMEAIFVRHDTSEVVEGNSRLAAYRILEKNYPKEPKWKKIRCLVVDTLSDSLQRAYLNQLHREGKTPWRTYETAYWIYSSIVLEGCSKSEMARDIGATEAELGKLIKVIEMMIENGDADRENFSFYNVILRRKDIYDEFQINATFGDYLYKEIKKKKKIKSFTAFNIREYMPTIIKKKKLFIKLLNGSIDFQGAISASRETDAKRIIDQATEILEELQKDSIEKMEKNDIEVAKIAFRRLKKEVNRIEKLLKE